MIKLNSPDLEELKAELNLVQGYSCKIITETYFREMPLKHIQRTGIQTELHNIETNIRRIILPRATNVSGKQRQMP